MFEPKPRSVARREQAPPTGSGGAEGDRTPDLLNAILVSGI